MNELKFLTDLSNISNIYKSLHKYDIFLSSYKIEDEGLKSFLITYNNCLFDKFILNILD